MKTMDTGGAYSPMEFQDKMSWICFRNWGGRGSGNIDETRWDMS